MEEAQSLPSKDEVDILASDDPNILYFDCAMEWLYQNYRTKQKRPGLKCFVIATILYDAYIYLAGVPPVTCLSLIIIPCTIFNILTLIGALTLKGILKNIFWISMPHITVHTANIQILATLFLLKNDVVMRDILGWAMLYSYLIYIILPFKLSSCCLFSLFTAMTYLVPLVWIRTPEIHYPLDKIKEPIGCLSLLVMANIFGFLSYIAEDKQQRTAFVQTKRSLKVKLVIEEQTEEQERLLLSVLPRHVAVQMRQDLDRADSQFKKIYMSRHENVSILYADIVGFTAISSTYSAQELVKMLNELFARFDKLAEKYDQLRIKILGDCYYCISGAPIQRSDHAVLCVHMGLSMVKAIKYVQQTANSPVDMRVGIHTGAVLAGVLGQRQWQFDVYSKDVELANKMESSGKAGKVHISGTTLSFLNGEFEVEPAFGEKRDETLRMAGLKTYFIVKVLKPFESNRLKQLETGKANIISDGGCKINNLQTVWPEIRSIRQGDTQKKLQNGLSAPILPDTDSYVIMDLQIGAKEEKKVVGRIKPHGDSSEFKQRLKYELMNKDGHTDLSANTNSLTLTFVDSEKEKHFLHYLKNLWTITSLLYFLTRITVTIFAFMMFPFNFFLFYCYENLIFMLIFLLMFLEEWMSAKNCGFQICRKSMTLRMIFTVILVLTLAILNGIETVACLQTVFRNDMFEVEDGIQESTFYPSAFSYFAILILMATVFPSCLPYLLKAVLLAFIAVGQCLINIFIVDDQLDKEVRSNQWSVSHVDPKRSLTALLCIIAIILAIMGRHTEQVTRVLFLWISKLKEQRDCAADLQRRNEALVYNILPPHVAAHFLGNNNRNHEELYSLSYDEVGVLFASMPNFSDFYSEESVNNQGLECLRFLNEVISDFDALLALPQYQDIIKIKTIGSTYMAASGLNPTKKVKPDDPVRVRCAHLALLIEFALDLKKALHSINEQSFNHFVLKMGINHGPITAGVIGARKPHYDIWGNTVNVASRMESTGKAGCIQVTEETSQILKAFGYQFEQRGLVAVKGKGDLMTYYLVGKANGIETPPTAPVSPDIVQPTVDIKNEAEKEDVELEKSNESVTSKSDKTIMDCSEKIDDEVFLLDTEIENNTEPDKIESQNDTDEGTALLES